MRIPDSMTEEEVMSTIMLVINRTAPKYTFYGYEVDDIKQESFMICVDALDRYKEGRPLENFLAVHLSNRLKNFVRDNHFTQHEQEKAKVVMPGQLSDDNNIVSPQSLQAKRVERIDTREMQKIIDIKLPAQYRMDYLKIINDVYVPKKQKEEVLSIIEQILKEQGYA
jgi:DNA-directed RNA polymerase specialized sigma24 family protein